jgi:hypothetical protein
MSMTSSGFKPATYRFVAQRLNHCATTVLCLWKVTRQEDINVEIRKRKFRWIGHTLRIEGGEIPKSALFWNPRGNRKRGRPRNSWRK